MKTAFPFRGIIKFSIYLILGFSITGCANIVPPAGGPVDKTPPKILSQKPGDSSLNQKIKKIEIVFDKYMELGDISKNLNISPSLKINPTVEARLKKVIISIPDTLLLDNTTYTLSLGEALKDNREGTPYPNFTFLFSTGNYFDSLSIKGSAINAANMQVDTGLFAFLYDTEDFNDSIIMRQKPMYKVKLDAAGNFNIDKLPNRPFYLFILKDNNQDDTYQKGWDEIAFIDAAIKPTYNLDTVYQFKYSLEEVDSQTNAQLIEANASTGGSVGARSRTKMSTSNPKLGNDETYRVLVDTLNKNSSTQNINKPISILIAMGIKNIDKDKIFLSFKKDQIDIESFLDINISDSVIRLQTEWQDNSEYTLRLVKGWATDSTGKELTPGRYSFKSKGKDQYGTLHLQIPQRFTTSHYLLQLLKEEEELRILPINDSMFTFDMLDPGVYTFKIIEDSDKNGKWTPGNYFNRTQPEKVIIHTEKVNLKAAWDLEIQFKELNSPNKSQSAIRGAANADGQLND